MKIEMGQLVPREPAGDFSTHEWLGGTLDVKRVSAHIAERAADLVRIIEGPLALLQGDSERAVAARFERVFDGLGEGSNVTDTLRQEFQAVIDEHIEIQRKILASGHRTSSDSVYKTDAIPVLTSQGFDGTKLLLDDLPQVDGDVERWKASPAAQGWKSTFVNAFTHQLSLEQQQFAERLYDTVRRHYLLQTLQPIVGERAFSQEKLEAPDGAAGVVEKLCMNNAEIRSWLGDSHMNTQGDLAQETCELFDQREGVKLLLGNINRVSALLKEGRYPPVSTTLDLRERLNSEARDLFRTALANSGDTARALEIAADPEELPSLQQVAVEAIGEIGKRTRKHLYTSSDGAEEFTRCSPPPAEREAVRHRTNRENIVMEMRDTLFPDGKAPPEHLHDSIGQALATFGPESIHVLPSFAPALGKKAVISRMRQLFLYSAIDGHGADNTEYFQGMKLLANRQVVGMLEDQSTERSPHVGEAMLFLDDNAPRNASGEITGEIGDRLKTLYRENPSLFRGYENSYVQQWGIA
ncbi:hypothetical protein MRY87_06750 [bacterium]|nr:hypothetical protein [bacterium]